MKKLEKMSLATIAGKLTRKEMKNIMAGSGVPWGSCLGNICIYDSTCWQLCNSDRPVCRNGKCTVVS